MSEAQAQDFMNQQRQEEAGGAMSEHLPPPDAKPGDTWGAYILCEDGWWRLNEKLVEETAKKELASK